MSKIQSFPFYGEWAGHPLSDLVRAHGLVRDARPDKPIVWFAGDSSLDNKAWVIGSGPGGDPLPVGVPKIYQTFLEKPTPKPDVAFWLNHFLADSATALNAAVEASLLRERTNALRPHDEFIRDNLRPQDVLVVSVGANDIALSPSAATTRNMLQLAWLTGRRSIENGSARSLAHFTTLFKDDTLAYISSLVTKQKPRAVVVCMIYFPLQADAGAQPGWAETQLKLLGYNRDPGQLQAAIRQMYKQATATIGIEGTTVIPCPLYEVLDGKNKEDYVARVEPSSAGGKKMAKMIHERLQAIL